MAEEGKKISFGFAKSIKKPVLKNVVLQEQKKVDYIECLDEKAIKVIGGEEKKDEPLIIPLLGSKTWHDRILNKVDADIFEPKTIKSETSESVKEEGKPDISNGNTLLAENIQSVKVKTEPTSDSENTLTLEQQAANEIIEDLKTTEEKVPVKEDLTLPLTEEETLRGKAESTLEDYEKIPIDAFGVAMLRGMGWQPGKGIGKNEKLVPAAIPELRPKGMGLGADKMTLQKQPPKESKKQEEELKIEKGTFVKFIAGKQSNSYGQIEGLDDDAGRLIIKLALGGQTVSVNEFMVQPVTKTEYTKNSKVLNAKKFEEFKEKHANKKEEASSSNKSENSEEEKQNNRKDSKKERSRHRMDEKNMKSRKRHSSESDNSSDYGKRTKHRSRSNSSDSHQSKKVKKSKKHKKYDSPSEKSSKKYKKKDKERERTKDKKSRDSKYGDRRKRKKHRRSRSRS